MLKLIFRRLLEAVPTLLFLITISFFMMRLAPGSPFSNERDLSPAILANIEAKYNLNAPLWQQYLDYLQQLMVLDFGPSFKYKDHTINELLAAQLPISIELGLYAFVIALVLGACLGIFAALRQNSLVDYLLMSLAMVGVAMPNFVKAPLLVLIFAVTLKWLPAGGWNDGATANLILPVTALSLGYVASIARIMRGSMIETLNAPFIRTARAKGLPMRHIILRHALRPAMLPVISYLAPAFVGIITGSIVIETIFVLPGVGQLFVNGALNRDYSLVLSLTIIMGALTILMNAIADILYALIDPKISH